MASFFLICANLGSVLSVIEGLDWLKNKAHTDKPVAEQLQNLAANIKADPETAKKLVNSPTTSTDTKTS